MPETHALDVPGARLRYDTHGDWSAPGAAERVLFLIGSPMDAHGFGTLCGLLADRPLLTYDPRHTGRSERTNDSPFSPDTHADDLVQVLDAAGLSQVDLLGSSGGAINGLALVTHHPDRVRTFIAHEPPSVSVLPDRAQLEAACRDIHETYQRNGMGHAMAKFMALTSHVGELPAHWADRPAPDPAQFGLPVEDDGKRDDPLLGPAMLNVPSYVLDFAALKAAPTRIVLAAGVESAGQLTERAPRVIADQLGCEFAEFPSHHGGFMGDEYGWRGDPEAFAARLVEVLDA